MLIGVSPKKSCTFAKSKDENVSPTRSDNVTSYPSVNPMELGFISNIFPQKTPPVIFVYGTDFHNTYKTIQPCSFIGKGPRKGWRTPLNGIKYSEQRDEETGYGYFGARNMDHELMTMWLSVDPMADKYPGVSPYAYCAWNPVSLVDPDGRDIWQLDNLGNIVDFVECEDYDCIHIVDSKGIIVRSSNCYEYGTISELCLNGQNNTTFSVCGFDNAKEVFEFLANYYTKDNGTPLEWAHGTIAEMSPWSLAPNNNTNVITTTHQNSSVDLGIWLDNGYVISRQAHNHPSGSNKPSDITDGNGRRHGDVPSALSFEKRYSAEKNYTYTQTWGYSEYDSKGTLDPRILNQNSLPEVKIK